MSDGEKNFLGAEGRGGGDASGAGPNGGMCPEGQEDSENKIFEKIVLGCVKISILFSLFSQGWLFFYKCQMKSSSNKQEKKYDFKWTPRMTTGAALMAPAVIAVVITVVIAAPTAAMLYAT